MVPAVARMEARGGETTRYCRGLPRRDWWCLLIVPVVVFGAFTFSLLFGVAMRGASCRRRGSIDTSSCKGRASFRR